MARAVVPPILTDSADPRIFKGRRVRRQAAGGRLQTADGRRQTALAVLAHATKSRQLPPNYSGEPSGGMRPSLPANSGPFLVIESYDSLQDAGSRRMGMAAANAPGPTGSPAPAPAPARAVAARLARSSDQDRQKSTN